MDNLPILIGEFLFFGVGALVILTLSIRSMRKSLGNQKNAMEDLAQLMNLPLLGGDPFFPSIKWLSFIRKPYAINNDWEGHQIKFVHETRGSDKNRTSYIIAKLYLGAAATQSTDVRMSISSVGWMSNLGINLGRKPLDTGDEAFDKQFVVKAHDDDFANTVLLPELRAQMLRTWDECDVKGTMRVEREYIQYEEVGHLRTEAQVRRFHELALIMSQMAAAIDVARAL